MPDSAPCEFFSASPRPPLAAFVESIWAVRGSSGYRRFTMLPNGAVQLMINFGAAHRVTAVGGRSVLCEHRQAWIAGLQDAPLAIESPPESNLLSIRFRPGGAHAFLPVPLQALTNDVVDADALLGASIGSLREQLALAPDRCRQVTIAQDWLLQRFRPRERDFLLVVRAFDAVADAQRTSVRDACTALGLSNEHMIRLFRRLAGLPPKTLARVQRFRSALGMLARGAGPHGQIALNLGYYDQAHFNRDFLHFAGVPPTTFMRHRGEDNESLIDG
jgi:AraC-like DNA-binding protein